MRVTLGAKATRPSVARQCSRITTSTRLRNVWSTAGRGQVEAKASATRRLRHRDEAGVEKTTPRNRFLQPFNQIRTKSTMASDKKFKFAGIQLFSDEDKKKNQERAKEKIKEAATNGAQLISLPECWNSPYATASFPKYAETFSEDSFSESIEVLSSAAKENNVYLIGGSIPERDGDKVYNTCPVFDPSGKLIAKHRKVHLFDVDIKGKITFKESETLSAGNSLTIFETQFCKIGIGICYDIRFAELALLYARQGCSMIVYPGAFNMTTGPLHWELLQRARAVDNQVYVAMVSPARNENSSYKAWGHTTVVNPWAHVIATTEHQPDIVYADIDLATINEIRSQIPVSVQRRTDLYDLSWK